MRRIVDLSCWLTAVLLLTVSPMALGADEVAEADEEATEDVAEEEDEEEEEDKGPTFAETVKGYRHLPGLFDLYIDDEENKVLFAIKPDQFGEIFLCNVSRTQGDGYFFDAASTVDLGISWGGMPMRFDRVGKTVYFKHPNVYYRAEPDAAIRRAVDRLSDSVMGTGTIEGQPHPETGAVLFDPSGMFVQDIAMIGFIFTQIDDVSYSMDGGMSYFSELANFPMNTEIDVVLTFTTSSPKIVIPTLPDSRSFQHIYHYSLSRLPESDFAPRLADDRVGHFLTMYQDYSSVLTHDPYVRHVTRWHLEKAEPRFKVSKPKKPIVFWLENSVPVEYRDAVREGVLLWNDAFEQIGFEDAIEVKQQPDDAEWDAADARYSTIRWIVQPGRGYAVGPSRANPFTGEIYDADIQISADYLRYAYREFTELADPLSRRQAIGDSIAAALGLLGDPTMVCRLADEKVQEAAYGWHVLNARAGAEGLADPEAQQYLRQLIIDLVAHEVGHTLGLRHNFKASTIHSLAELHDPETIRREGISGSVMDYNPVNLAPDGHPQGDYYMTDLGVYDYWAIEYAYRSFLDSENEPKQLSRIASRGAEPDLAYGTDEDAFYDARGIDPRATRYDLRDDPIAHYRDLVAISDELWSTMESHFEKKGERYQTLSRVFGWGFRPYTRGAGNVSRFVGGIYHHRDHIGDPKGRPPFVPVPAARQREALAFITEHVLGPDAFNWSPELLSKLAPERWQDFTWSQYYKTGRIEMPVHQIVANIQRQPLNRFYDPTLLQRLQDLELRFASDEEPFTMTELFSTLRASIWAEAIAGTPINSFRRNLQRAHMGHLGQLVLNPSAAPADARSLARADLLAIAEAIGTADHAQPMDAVTAAHLEETTAQISAILEAGYQRQ